LQSFVDGRSGFLRVPLDISIFDSKNQFATVMAREEPVEKRSPGAANVEKAGRRWGKSDADVRTHC
jgi:hypothetical protein